MSDFIFFIAQIFTKLELTLAYLGLGLQLGLARVSVNLLVLPVHRQMSFVLVFTGAIFARDGKSCAKSCQPISNIRGAY